MIVKGKCKNLNNQRAFSLGQNMKNNPINSQEFLEGKNIVKTKRKGYFRNIEEVKVVATIANIAEDTSDSKSLKSKVWVAQTSI